MSTKPIDVVNGFVAIRDSRGHEVSLRVPVSASLSILGRNRLRWDMQEQKDIVLVALRECPNARVVFCAEDGTEVFDLPQVIDAEKDLVVTLHPILVETTGEHVKDKLADDPYTVRSTAPARRPLTPAEVGLASPAEVGLALGTILFVVILFVFIVIFYR